MRNIITIDVSGECACGCVANIHDGTNSIQIIFETNSYTNPKIELNYNDTTTVLDLEIVNGFAIYDFPYSIFNNTTRCTFRFLDGEKIGSWFTLIGLYGGKIPPKKTLKVARLSAYEFTFAYHTISTTPVTSYNPDYFTISDDGELSLKDESAVEQITVTENGGKVTNVTLKYSDETESSNDCIYDSTTGKLIKFGSLPIDWGAAT